MSDHRMRFLEAAMRVQALGFGEFTLKSGRTSPYFFNAGRFDSGASLGALGEAYADAILEADIAHDVIFGPAYKGIPLATATVFALAQRGHDVPVAFNRKEAKDHGEGGLLIGAPLQGRRVLIVDDVITAGTAINEAVSQIRAAGGEPVGIVIGLDRQEVVAEGDPRSAAQAVAERHGVRVIPVATLDDLLALTARDPALAAWQTPLLSYRSRYGVTAAR